MKQDSDPIRLQKFLSSQGVCSRREAESFIEKGKIFVNGKKATLGDKVTGSENIIFNGVKISVRKNIQSIVLVWHKPTGVEVTFQNEHGGKTLNDFDFGSERVVPIGRLDKDSHGLLLLTNDGDLANEIAHPSYSHEKEYVVVVTTTLTPKILERLSSGTLEVNKERVQPCEVHQIKENVFRIILKEGKNRQIRRMCEACDLKVKELLRVRVNNIWLNELPIGKWRKLSSLEVEQLQK
jgi:23S rRNA pseudouridine2604 synthase